MKFTIGYPLPDEDFDPDTLLMGEAGLVNQFNVGCPELPEGFSAEKRVFVIDEDLQASVSVIEIGSIEQLLDLSRKLGRNLTIERQPQEMLDTIGPIMPEFGIVVGDVQNDCC